MNKKSLLAKNRNKRKIETNNNATRKAKVMSEKVTVYGRPNCVQCNATYRALEAKGVSYKKVDLGQHEEMATEFRNQGHIQAPVVVVESDLWSGFRPDKISQL